MSKGKKDDGGVAKFLWDSDTGTICGRTCSSWAKITAFYVAFYFLLGLFFLLMLKLFFLDLDLQIPKYQQADGLIGNNPGLGFRPIPSPDANEGSTLIWYKKSQKKDYRFWTDQLNDWFKGIPDSSSRFVKNCSFGNGGTETYHKGDKRKGQVSSCSIDVTQFGNCNSENEFGYPSGQPCIVIKLNRIFGWEPQGFGLNGKKYDAAKYLKIFADDMKEIEQEMEYNPQQGLKLMPHFLREYILKRLKNPEHSVQWKTDFLNSVFISCEGENPADKENIGPVSYHPHNYLPSYYYPVTTQPDYKAPFIMIQLQRPAIGVLINIRCRGWAKNIRHDVPRQLGMIHFEVLVDK